MPDYTVKPDIDALLRSDNNAAARTNLGAQAALTTASPLALNQGGTGAITASAALAALSGVPTTRTVSVGTGLTGGGDLSANRTISISSISTSQITGLGGAAVLSVGTTAGTVAAGDDNRMVNAALKTLNNTFGAAQTISASISAALLTAQQGNGSGASLAAIQTTTGTGSGLTVDIQNTASAAPAVRITNQGLGASLLVEDSNPDTTPFTISASGRVGVGVTPDASAAVAIDAGGIKFVDGTVQTTAATGGGGTVTSVNVSGGTTGITTSGGPVTNSGTITLGGTLAIANGGTGQTTSTAALNALLPTQTGNTGKVLSTDGANATWTTASGAPSGPAGGDLTGTYPNPTLAAVAGLTSGQYGSASSVAQVTVNAKGQTTLASNVAIAIATSQVTGLSATALGAITQLTGDVTTTAGGGSKAATLATIAGLTTGQYGSASSVAQITVNAKGLLTLATNVNIAITTSQVSGLNADAVGALALTGGTVTGQTIIDVNDNVNPALRITQSGTAAAIVVEDITSDTSPFVVNQDGRVLIGKTTTRVYNGTTPSIQGEGTTLGTSSLGLTSNTTTAGTSATLFLSRTRGTTVGSSTSVQNSDVLGNVAFQGADGTNTIQGASILAVVDGTVGTNDLPASIQFLTRGQGQASPSNRMTISSAGKIGIGTTPDAAAALKVDTNGIMFGDGSTQTTAATGGTPTDVQVFTSSGTWTKPAGATSVQITVIGGGGGGGSGRRGLASGGLFGGGGGAGAGYTQRTIAANLLGATETVTVGGGGNGGGAQINNDTNGNAGASGTASSFGTWVFAAGGTLGAAGGVSTGTGGSVSSQRAMFSGGGGGSSSNTGTGSSGGNAATGGGGGGAGAGLTTVTGVLSGGVGGIALTSFTSATNTAGGTSDGASGTAGLSVTANWPLAGMGGGGGASSAAGAAGSGGAGGLYGAGGGGGGASTNGNNSGAGGAGANGIIVVTTYF